MSTMVHSRHVIIITTTWNWGKPSLMNIPSQRFSVKSILILASDARVSLESGVLSWDAAIKILYTFISPAQCCSGLLCSLFQIQILPPVQFSSRRTKDREWKRESPERSVLDPGTLVASLLRRWSAQRKPGLLIPTTIFAREESCSLTRSLPWKRLPCGASDSTTARHRLPGWHGGRLTGCLAGSSADWLTTWRLTERVGNLLSG
jgi:hypothetical protein